MSDELTDLLHTASRAIGGDLHADPEAVMARARRTRLRHRAAGLCAVALLVLVGAAVLQPTRERVGKDVDVATGGGDEEFALGWTQLPSPPLSPRTGATAAAIAGEIVVVGGSQRFCRPLASCIPVISTSGNPAGLADGATYNLTTRTWRPIAPAPVGFVHAKAIVIDGATMVLPECDAVCEQGRYSRVSTSKLLRYQPARDIWDTLPTPPIVGPYALVAVGTGLVASFTSDASDVGPQSDWRLDMKTATWTKLPDDPLPPVTDRKMVADGNDLLVFGTTIGDFGVLPKPVVGARLDAAGQWTTLPSTPGAGYRALSLDGQVVMVPGTDQEGGGIFDVATDTWAPLPTRPAGAEVVGAFNPMGTSLAAVDGWVLDVAAGTWAELPRLNISGAAVASFGRHLFRFGGVSYARPQGDLLGDAWVWTAPPSSSVPTMLVAPTETSVPPTTVPPVTETTVPPTAVAPPTTVAAVTTTPSTLAPPPTTAKPPVTIAPKPGPPQFVSATGAVGDLAAGGNGGLGAGRVTLRFDRPVVGGESPATECCPAGYLAAMRLIVYGADSTCGTPAGNAHAYLAGVGTDTITTDASSLVAGTTYVSIIGGFVLNAQDGAENTTVNCIGIPVSG